MKRVRLLSRLHWEHEPGVRNRDILAGEIIPGGKRPHTCLQPQRSAKSPCFQRSVTLVLLAGLPLTGCGRKEKEAVVPQQPASAQKTRPEARNKGLQAEMDALARLPHEHDPAKRPLVLSTPAPNRRDWAVRALEKGYADSGHKNDRWDSAMHAVFEAYADYSRAGVTDARYTVLTNAVAAAAARGVDDPMLQYMIVRYGLDGTNTTQEQFAFAYLHALRGMFASRYHPAFKFTAGYRAAEAARSADSTGNRAAPIEFTTAALEDLARDTNAPVAEVFEAVFLWVEYSRAKTWVNYVMTDLLPILERNWGREEPFFRLNGLLEVNRAWEDRGGGFANTVSDTGWQGFAEHLKQAENSLQIAWQMNPSNAYTAYLMMKVELGQGKGKSRMEQWFHRAMALATNYHDAVSLMAFYLEPRWYGSDDEALRFARSCVTSSEWGGTVPLILPELHHSLAKYYKREEALDYWDRDQVREDVRSAYEKFFRLNPEAYDYRHNYARDAYLCRDYSQFLAQTKLFGGYTNFEYFGGEDKFRQMLARASAAVAAPGN